MNDRKEQIKRAVTSFFTLLTGTRKEVKEMVTEIAEDAEEQLQHRRRIGGAITVEGKEEP